MKRGVDMVSWEGGGDEEGDMVWCGGDSYEKGYDEGAD